MGKGVRRLVPPTGGRKGDTVEARQEGAQQEKSREDKAEKRGERKNYSRHGNSGKDNIGPPKPTRSRRPKLCGKDNHLERRNKEKEKRQQAYN